MEQIFVYMIIEVIKIAGSALRKSALPQLPSSESEGQTPGENNTTNVSLIQNNTTIVHRHAFDKQFLQEVIKDATDQLSNLVEASAQEIMEEVRHQYIQSAVQKVQALVTVLRRQLMHMEKFDPNIAMQMVISALNPLQVALEVARIRLIERHEEDAWNLCYIAGTSTLIAGYTFLDQDVPELKAELESKMQQIQIEILDTVARKVFDDKGEFPWERVPLLLSPDGADDLSALYRSAIRPAAEKRDVDPNDMTVNEIKAAISEIDDIKELRRILAKERRGRHRIGSEDAIEIRIDQLKRLKRKE